MGTSAHVVHEYIYIQIHRYTQIQIGRQIHTHGIYKFLFERGAWEMAQLVKYLLCIHDGLNAIPRTRTEARCTSECL